MDRINWKFSDKFRSHWIKVKFYEENPKLKDFVEYTIKQKYIVDKVKKINIVLVEDNS